MKTICKDGILLRLAKDMYPEKDDLSSIEVKTLFNDICHKYIQREGIYDLLSWLEGTDFYRAPASTRYHGDYEGGLCDHSLHVYFCFRSYVKKRCEPGYHLSMSEESIALCALFHDLCKVDIYKTEMRNKKNAQGQWEQVPFYTIEDAFPVGHGSKSVYIMNRYLKLTDIETAAIAYHMGFSYGDDARTVGNVFGRFPEAFALSTADMEATYFVENEHWPR